MSDAEDLPRWIANPGEGHIALALDPTGLRPHARRPTYFRFTGVLAGPDPLPERLELFNGASSLGQVDVSIPAESLPSRLARLARSLPHHETGVVRGFRARISRLNLSGSLPIRVHTREVPDTPGGPLLGELRGIAPYAPGPFRPRVVPLLVNSEWRSGTSMTMAMLNAHPQIMASSASQFEFRQASYLWHVAEILSSPGNFLSSMHPDSFEKDNRFTVGQNPYWSEVFLGGVPSAKVTSWLEREFVFDQIAFFVRQYNKYCRALSEDLNKTGARYLAEKVTNSGMVWFVRRLLKGTFTIYLMRDPRDVCISAAGLLERRGRVDARPGSADRRRLLRAHAAAIASLLEAYDAEPDRSCLIRYEDLVQYPLATLGPLFQRLGLDASEKTLQGVLETMARDDPAHFAIHRTSGGAAPPVERWRTEMTDEERALSLELFGPVLLRFGYPQA